MQTGCRAPRLRAAVWAAAALLLCAGALARADVITLKNGRTLRGQVVERRLTEIVLRVESGEITIKQSEIAAIQTEEDFDRLVGDGAELAARRQYERAAERYRQALALRPDAPELREKIIACYREQARERVAAGDVEGADRTLRAWLVFAPGDAEAVKSMTTLNALKGRVAEFVDRAALLFDIGAYSESAAEYQRAIVLAPERAAAWKPALAAAYAEWGNVLFIQQRYPEAAVQFGQALRLAAEPRPATRTDALGSAQLREVRKRWAYAMLVPIINQINADRMRTASDWEGALDLAQRVAQDAPDALQVFYLQGLCQEALGQVPAAAAAYARILGGPAPANPTQADTRALRDRAHEELRKDPVQLMVATKDERWLAVLPGEWRVLATEHFVVFHRNEHVAQKVARAAEYWYSAIVVHWTAPGTYTPWRRKCEIYLYPSREAFQQARAQPDWVPAVTQVFARNGELIEHRISTYQTARLINEALLPHELTHVVLPQFLGYPQSGPSAPAGATTSSRPAGADALGALPRWIHECAALLEEPDYKRFWFRNECRTHLADGTALSLKTLMAVGENPPNDQAQRFYAQCHAIAEYLMTRGGRAKLLEFAKATLTQGDERGLLATYQFPTLADFDQAWRAWVQAQK
jgi:tetratricopeptide (TPR) repeat protein